MKPARDTLKEARKLIDNRQYNRAESLLLQLLDINPTNRTCYNYLIELYGKSWRAPKAREFFDRAERLGIADVYTLNSMIRSYSAARDIKGAKEIYEKANARGISNAMTYWLMADAYYRAKAYNAAIGAIEGFPANLKGDFGVVSVKANALRKLEKCQEALEFLEPFLLNGGFSQGQKNRLLDAKAFALLGANRRQEAIDIFRSIENEALQTSHEFWSAVCGLVFARAIHGDEAQKYIYLLEEHLAETTSAGIKDSINSALLILRRQNASSKGV